MIQSLGSAEQMASYPCVHQQIFIGGGSDLRAHGRKAGNKLRYGKFELADEHPAGSGHGEADAVSPGRYRRTRITPSKNTSTSVR
jgi:hypothetical protein